jgi:hypothetical protein
MGFGQITAMEIHLKKYGKNNIVLELFWMCSVVWFCWPTTRWTWGSHQWEEPVRRQIAAGRRQNSDCLRESSLCRSACPVTSTLESAKISDSDQNRINYRFNFFTFNGTHLEQNKVSVTSGANVVVHVVPVVVLKLFGGEGHPWNFVRQMIRGVKSVAVMYVKRMIWVPN